MQPQCQQTAETSSYSFLSFSHLCLKYAYMPPVIISAIYNVSRVSDITQNAHLSQCLFISSQFA